MQLFNQITLICDWWFNIDCSKSAQFIDYSNSRLREDGLHFLDDDLEAVAEATGAVKVAESAPALSEVPAKKKGKTH